MSAALEYHRATNVPPGGTDEDEVRTIETKPSVFKDYGDARRVPPGTSLAGRLLQDGAGIVRSQARRDYGGGTIHWRAYSSAGALYPVEAYVAAADGLFSFDALSPGLVRIGGDVRARLAEAAALDAVAEELVVLTGIHERTGWKYMERGYRHIWWDAGTMLSNLLALAAADGLAPRLYTAFVDAEVNEALGVDGEHEYALAVLALGRDEARADVPAPSDTSSPGESGVTYPLALRAHAESSLADANVVREWRAAKGGDEPKLDRDALARAIRRRRSVRAYSDKPLPREEMAALLRWSEAPIPADAAPVVRQLVTVAAVEGLEPGVYDADLNLLAQRDGRELREAAGFAAMEQEHPRDAAVNVFQLGDLEAIVERLGDRGYRWAQLEAGIRAGRLQIGAFMRGWGAGASTFYDDEVSRLLYTHESPLLMVAIGAR
jgi:SagB-type dehydrogenase family enzyme